MSTIPSLASTQSVQKTSTAGPIYLEPVPITHWEDPEPEYATYATVGSGSIQRSFCKPTSARTELGEEDQMYNLTEYFTTPLQPSRTLHYFPTHPIETSLANKAAIQKLILETFQSGVWKVTQSDGTIWGSFCFKALRHEPIAVAGHPKLQSFIWELKPIENRTAISLDNSHATISPAADKATLQFFQSGLTIAGHLKIQEKTSQLDTSSSKRHVFSDITEYKDYLPIWSQMQQSPMGDSSTNALAWPDVFRFKPVLRENPSLYLSRSSVILTQSTCDAALSSGSLTETLTIPSKPFRLFSRFTIEASPKANLHRRITTALQQSSWVAHLLNYDEANFPDAVTKPTETNKITQKITNETLGQVRFFQTRDVKRRDNNLKELTWELMPLVNKRDYSMSDPTISMSLHASQSLFRFYKTESGIAANFLLKEEGMTSYRVCSAFDSCLPLLDTGQSSRWPTALVFKPYPRKEHEDSFDNRYLVLARCSLVLSTATNDDTFGFLEEEDALAANDDAFGFPTEQDTFGFENGEC